jgi:hypothetical protein
MVNATPTGAWWLDVILFGAGIVFWGFFGVAAPRGIPVETAVWFWGVGGALLSSGLWGGRRAGWKIPGRTPEVPRKVEVVRRRVP